MLDIELSSGYLQGKSRARHFRQSREQIEGEKPKNAGNCEPLMGLAPSSIVTGDGTGG